MPAAQTCFQGKPSRKNGLTRLYRHIRFAQGRYGVTLPAGYTAQGLPIGMQAIGRAWEESLLLRVAVNAEEVVERKAPRVHYRIL
ncbi:MAG: hypothetical protein GW861_14515 [Deltaproteobacteria bacterium]|nr:hypothetical protein [Deltaproteobacteria bacterium]